MLGKECVHCGQENEIGDTTKLHDEEYCDEQCAIVQLVKESRERDDLEDDHWPCGLEVCDKDDIDLLHDASIVGGEVYHTNPCAKKAANLARSELVECHYCDNMVRVYADQRSKPTCEDNDCKARRREMTQRATLECAWPDCDVTYETMSHNVGLHGNATDDNGNWFCWERSDDPFTHSRTKFYEERFLQVPCMVADCDRVQMFSEEEWEERPKRYHERVVDATDMDYNGTYRERLEDTTDLDLPYGERYPWFTFCKKHFEENWKSLMNVRCQREKLKKKMDSHQELI